MKIKIILLFTMLFFAGAAFSQNILIKKAKLNSNVLAKQTRFKGKLTTPAIVGAGSSVPANRRTISNGVTKEVLPYDGSTTGAKETASTKTDSKSGNTICNTQTITLSAGYNELNLLDPNGVEIWPGRVINISSMDEGSYTNFTGFTGRRDMKIALVAAGAAQTSVIRTLQGNNITQGTVIDAVNNIKNSFGRNDFGSDSWMYESYSFFKTEQLLIEAGAGVNATPINLEIRANAGFNTAVKKNKVVLKFVREAFDVKVDTDLDSILTASNLSIDAGIISNVMYGQLGIIEIESDSSLTSMNAALDFAFNVDPTVSISGSLRSKLQATIASFSIKGIFKGVQGNAAIISVPSINELKNMLLGNGAITATTPVVPLAFTVKSLKDGATMMLRSTMSYNRQECTVLPPNGNTKLAVKFLALTVPKVNDGFSDDEDIFGQIRVKTNLAGSTYRNVWTKPKANNVKVKNSQRPADPGAYSLTGDATDYEFEFSNDLADVGSRKLFVNVKLEDDEAFRVMYGEKTLEIPFGDLLQSITATGTTVLDNFSAADNAFFIDVVENGNTNKVRVWFRVRKLN